MQHLCNIFVLDFGDFLERKGREGMLPVWKCCQLPVANSQLETGHWIPATLATFVARAPLAAFAFGNIRWRLQIFARMSGMLDLSNDEKAKHLLPR